MHLQSACIADPTEVHLNLHQCTDSFSLLHSQGLLLYVTNVIRRTRYQQLEINNKSIHVFVLECNAVSTRRVIVTDGGSGQIYHCNVDVVESGAARSNVRAQQHDMLSMS